MNKKFVVVLILWFISAASAGCGKPRLFGKEMEVRPITQSFPVDAKTAFKATKDALAFYGYDVQKEDEKASTLETHWQPTTSDSHYVIVFNRPDYGTVGAYHKVVAKISSQGNQSTVEIYSQAQSIISNRVSIGHEEHKILTKIADFTRKPNIEVTNVGLQ